MERKREYKAFPGVVTVTDPEQGIVKCIFAVMGNVDGGGDVIHPGAFTKTFTEHGSKVLVLDQHQMDSIQRVLGKPLAMREMSAAELPLDLTSRYQDASGAAEATIQFLLNTPEGKGAFERIKSGAVNQWSFGYDAINPDYSQRDGNTVRNLREVKLYEISPVLFGMNAATMTTGVKADESGAKVKPGEGESEGDFMGRCVPAMEGEGREHDQAVAMCLSMYSEGKAVTRTEGDEQHPASHYLVVEDAEKPSTWHLRVRDASGKPDHRLMGAAWAALHGGYRGNRYEGPGKRDAIAELRKLYEAEEMPVPGENAGAEPEAQKAGRRVRAEMVKRVRDMQKTLNEFLRWAEYEDEEDTTPGEGQACSQDDDEEKQAGPRESSAPTQDLKSIVELLKVKQHFMEVQL